jgi:hypothetical protein
LLCAFSSVALGTGELSCPPGENFAQEAISPTEIPAKLTQILLYHKGYGLFAKFAEEKKFSSYSGPCDPQVKSFFCRRRAFIVS